MKKDRY